MLVSPVAWVAGGNTGKEGSLLEKKRKGYEDDLIYHFISVILPKWFGESVSYKML